jgi:predicted RNA binding protein YcfA (HicA-like mRNA interferase family)
MHRELLGLTSQEVEGILQRHGFVLKRVKGSHQQFIGFVRGRKRKVTVIKNQ